MPRSSYHRWCVHQPGQWQCSVCLMVVRSRLRPRIGHGVRDLDGRTLHSMPTCQGAERVTIQRTHRWHVRTLAGDSRALWSCLRCGVQAETPVSSPNPSGAMGAECFRRATADAAWSPYTGKLGIACAP